MFSGSGLLVVNGDNTFDLLKFSTDGDNNKKLARPTRCAITFDIPKHGQIRVIDSCNGFICLSHSYSDDNDVTLFVANPILGECIALPKPKRVSRSCLSAYAFGFSPCSQQYKILSIVSEVFLTHPNEARGEICTLGIDCAWKSVRCKHFPDDKRFVTVNGAFHWLASNPKGHNYIYSLNIDEEKVQKICLPFLLRGVDSGINVGVIFDHLCVVKSSWNAIYSTVDIWLMKIYGETWSWTRQYTVQMDYPFCFPARVWKNEEVVVWRSMHRTLHSYSIAEDAYTELEVSSCQHAFDAVTYSPFSFSLEDIMTGSYYNHIRTE